MPQTPQRASGPPPSSDGHHAQVGTSETGTPLPAKKSASGDMAGGLGGRISLSSAVCCLKYSIQTALSPPGHAEEEVAGHADDHRLVVVRPSVVVEADDARRRLAQPHPGELVEQVRVVGEPELAVAKR